MQQKVLQPLSVTLLVQLMAFVLLATSATGQALPQAPGKKKPASGEAVAEAGAVSTSRLALPFKRLWHFVDDLTTLAPATDSTSIYLPLAGGRVVRLDRDSGAILWSSDLGGRISASVVIVETAVFVVTRKIAEDGTEAGATLRALDKTTGLTLWAKDYPRPFTSPLTPHQGRLYAGSADGSLYAIAAADGEVIWKSATQDIVRGHALVTETAVYFGSDDGALRGVEMDKGREIFKFQTQGKIVGAPVADQQRLYFGSGDGFVYAVEKQTGKLQWRSRTGAAIEASPALLAGKLATKNRDKLLVASFDNFIYALSCETGDRIWKRRLENRLAATPIVVGDATLVAPLRGDHVAVFLHADGRRVNYYRLERELEIVADPIFADDLLLLTTNQGLIAATPTQPSDPRANAQEKK